LSLARSSCRTVDPIAAAAASRAEKFFFFSVCLSLFLKKNYSLSLSTPPTLLHQLDDVDDLALCFGSSDGFADGGSAAPAASVPTASARHGRRSSGKLRCFLTRSLYSLLLAACCSPPGGFVNGLVACESVRGGLILHPPLRCFHGFLSSVPILFIDPRSDPASPAIFLNTHEKPRFFSLRKQIRKIMPFFTCYYELVLITC